MSDHVCIANAQTEIFDQMGRPRRCVRRGEHYAACENPDACRGCVPRTATWGFLCPVHADKARDALSRAVDLMHHLRSIEKAAQPIGQRVDGSMANRLVIPETWTAADGLMTALGAPPFRSTDTLDQVHAKAWETVGWWVSNIDTFVNTIDGAAMLIVLIDRMQTALTRWPDSEAQYRKIPHMLCPTCKQQTLYRRAPLEYLDDILVTCSNVDCRYSIDWFEWSTAYAGVFASLEAEHKRTEIQDREHARKRATK